MRYADSLGFLLSQDELMNHRMDARFDPSLGLDLCHVTVAPPFMKDMASITKELDWFLPMANQQENVRIARQPSDLSLANLNLVCGLQYPPEDAMPDDLTFLRELGVVFMTLAYELESPFGGGFAAPDAPLTARGKELISMMGKTGMVLDLSHAGERTAWEALDYVRILNATGQYDEVPWVAATHTACHAVYPHGRNLNDEALQRIADLDGFVGIVTATFMLDAEDNGLDPFVRHFRHALDIVGPDNIGIGTDGVYKTMDLEAQKRNFMQMKEKIDPRGNFKARFPDQPIELNSPRKLQVLGDRLVCAGIDEMDATQAVGHNFVQFLTMALEH